MKKIISNAFSLQMLKLTNPQNISVEPLSTEEAAKFAQEAESSVGHADTASIMTHELKTSIACNRRNDTLETGDQVLVGQFTGGRLPEGAISLPEGVSLYWVLVSIK
jgi:hypothetical protein